MPETRYVITYENSVEVSKEPYEVSDEQLYQEALRDKFNAGHEDLIKLLKNWATMTDSQKVEAINQLVPYCAEWMLWKDGWLKLGIL